MSEVYVSVDVEADGPIPGPNSMLSLGSAAFSANGRMLDTFSINLETMEGAVGDPKTMAWWKTQPEAWAACRKDLVPPEEAMRGYLAWLGGCKRPVFVGYPATYDFMFTYWYLVRFTGERPFSHSGLDIKTYAMCLLGTEFRESTKKNMPKSWFGRGKHTHRAVDDAIEQGELFCNMLKYRKERFVVRPR